MRLFFVIVLLSFVFTLSGCISQSSYDTLQNQYNSLQNQYNSLQEDYHQFQQQIIPLQEQLKSLQLQLGESLINAEKLQNEYNEAQAELKLYQDTGIKVHENINPNVNKDITFFNTIELTRNPNAHNPTYSELISFINSDNTDRSFYGFDLCGYFAETLFNHAEEFSIRVAFVTIKFQEGGGHALNAFNTTDKGLIYIDCTGEDLTHYHLYPRFTIRIGDTTGNDKIAYVIKDKPLGFISIGTSYGLNYSDYQQWQADVNNMKSRFHSAITNTELYQLKNESDLNLGSFWEQDSTPSNIVKSINIYW